MMMFSGNPVHFEPELFDLSLDAGEIHELLSRIHSQLPVNSPSGSESNRSVYSAEERKIRRMLSNRNSARRSRWRKKRQLEDLTNEANRLRIENRHLKTRLCSLTHQCHMADKETDRLMSESIQLQHNLAGLQQVLFSMQQLQLSPFALSPNQTV